MKRFYNFLKDFYSFLKNIHSSGSPESSKRFYGGIGFMCSIIMIWTNINIKNELVETLMFVSAGMIGLETLTNLFRKHDNGK